MKLRSTLPIGAPVMLIAVLLDVVVLVCVVTMLSSRVGVPYGFEVKAPPSRFLMRTMGQVQFISVTGGDMPAFYLDNKLIPNGLDGVNEHLNRLTKTGDSAINGIVLRLDATVSRALEQQLIDLVLSHGLACHIATESSPLEPTGDAT